VYQSLIMNRFQLGQTKAERHYMNKMIGIAVLALGGTLSAKATLYWNFTADSSGSYYGSIQASGTFTTANTPTTLTGDLWGANVTSLTGYQITGISGIVNGAAISGLVPNQSFPGQTLSYYFGYIWDNALVAPQNNQPAQFDVAGLLFYYNGNANWMSLSANNIPDGGGYGVSLNGDWHVDPITVTITPSLSPVLYSGLTSVPEPTTMVAGALLLLPFGMSIQRMLRKSRMA